MEVPSCLVDTNVLLRMTRHDDRDFSAASKAIIRLDQLRTRLCYTHQNISELWNVMTRPASRNGFGLTATETESHVRAIETSMEFLSEGGDVYRSLIAFHNVLGAQVHDARLAATMMVHGIKHLLTFKPSDFKRYTAVVTFQPEEVLAENW